MCAISRVVVVLPLVPVTATTGIRGRDRRGPVAGLGRGRDAGRRRSARRPPSTAAAPSSASSTGPSASPSACARSRWRHGKATTISSDVVGRPHADGEPLGARPRPRRAASASTAPHGEPLAVPGARLARSGRAQADAARRAAQPSVRGARKPGHVERELDRGAGEVEVRTVEDAELDEGDAESARRVPWRSSLVARREAGAHAPIAWKPPSTWTISPVVAGKKSRQQRDARPGRSGSGSVRSQPERRAVAPRPPRTARSRGWPWRPGSSAGRPRPGCSGCPSGRGRGPGSGCVDSSAALATPIQS